jgi:hypothetical protein
LFIGISGFLFQRIIQIKNEVDIGVKEFLTKIPSPTTKTINNILSFNLCFSAILDGAVEMPIVE